MDIDVIGRHMPGLLEFKKRVEQMLESGAAGAASDEINGQISGLDKRLVGVEAWIKGISPMLDDLHGLKTEVEAKLSSLDDMLTWFGENREGLEVLLSIGDKAAASPPAPVVASAPAVSDKLLAHIAEVEAQLDAAPAADEPAVTNTSDDAEMQHAEPATEPTGSVEAGA